MLFINEENGLRDLRWSLKYILNPHIAKSVSLLLLLFFFFFFITAFSYSTYFSPWGNILGVPSSSQIIKENFKESRWCLSIYFDVLVDPGQVGWYVFFFFFQRKVHELFKYQNSRSCFLPHLNNYKVGKYSRIALFHIIWKKIWATI